MKKALSFAVALGLVAGAASVASAAELTVTGDARWRGVYTNNTQLGSTSPEPDDLNPDKVQRMDQRYRLNIAVKVNDDVTVNTRLVAADNIFGAKVTDAAGVDQTNSLKTVADRANMVIKTLGGTWTIGRQEATWANAALPYLAKDVSVDRFKATYKSGDFTYGGYLQQNVEGDAFYDNGDGDQTTWGAFGIGKAGDTNYGLLLNYVTSDTNAAKASGKDTGFLVDPYFNTKVGSATILGELLYKGGDLYKDGADNDQYGMFVAAVVDLKPITVTGVAAYAKNGATADSHWAPTLMIGTTQETGVMNFGAGSDDTAFLVGGVVQYAVSDKLTVGATLGYVDASKEADVSLTEFDLTAKYQLAQNASYRFGVGYLKPKNASAADDALLVIGNAVEVAW